MTTPQHPQTSRDPKITRLRARAQTCRNSNGFTLVELLVVLIVIAIIIAIAVPTLASINGTPAKESPEQSLEAATAAANTYFVENNYTFAGIEDATSSNVATLAQTQPELTIVNAGPSGGSSLPSSAYASTGPTVISISDNTTGANCTSKLSTDTGSVYCVGSPSTLTSAPPLASFYGDLIMTAASADGKTCYVSWDVTDGTLQNTSDVRYGYYSTTSSADCIGSDYAILAVSSLPGLSPPATGSGFQVGTFPGTVGSGGTCASLPPAYAVTTTTQPC